VRNRGIEKKIFAEHKALDMLKEVEAKVKYTKKCRALKTYGVTFFLVKVCLSLVSHLHLRILIYNELLPLIGRGVMRKKGSKVSKFMRNKFRF